MNANNIYTAGGGTVQAGVGLYLQRQADAELQQLCQEGVFAYVLTARQMGKSSLMVATAKHLVAEGSRTVIIDLQQLGVQSSAEQWYLGFVTVVARKLRLQLDVGQWWQSYQQLGISQRLKLFFEEVVLSQVAERIVVFVDEIDTTLSLPFTDDFFIAIRAFYEERSRDPAFQRLSFVLIGVATPGDLIADGKRTPFNIGQRVDLTDFTLEEAMPLAVGLGDLSEAEQQRVMGWVLDWTGGHPYLTQRLCQEMAQVGGSWTEAEVERLVSRTFFGVQSEKDNNLQFVRDMLTKRAPEPRAVIQTYRQVWQGKLVVKDEEQSLLKSHLKLSGVVKRVGKALQVRNGIYQRVFDGQWIREQLPESLWVRLKPAMPIIAMLLVAVIGMSGIAGYANQQRASAVDALQKAEEQTKLAQSSQENATREAENAKRQKHEADQQRKNATQQARIATQQQQRAEEQSKIANTQRQRAEEQTQVAIELRQQAEEQTQIANKEKRRADVARQEAERFLTSASLREKAAKSLYWLSTPLEQVDGMIMAMQAVAESRRKMATETYSPLDSSLLSAVQIVAEQNVLMGHAGHVTFSRDGRSIFGDRDNAVLLWDLNGNVIEKPLQGRIGDDVSPDKQIIRAVSAVSPDGYVVSTDNDNDQILHLWDLEGNAIGKPFEGHTKAITSVAFSHDGKYIASGSEDQTVRLWDLEGNAIGEPFRGHILFIRSVAFSPDGQHIVSSGGDAHGAGSELRLWDLNGKAIEVHFQAQAQEHYVNYSAVFSPDGQYIASGGDDNTVRLWNLEGKLMGKPFVGHTGGIISLAFSPDGKRIVSGSKDHTMRLWDLHGGQIRQPFQVHTDDVLSVAFSPDGQRIVSSSDGEVRLWNLQGNAIGQAFKADEDTSKVNLSVVSPNGQRIVGIMSDNTMRLWDVDGKPIGNPFQGYTDVRSVAFSPNSQRIVSGSDDSSVRLWNLYGKPIGNPFQGHRGAVLSVAFSPDGQRIVSGSNDNTVRLWDLEGNPIGQPFNEDTPNIVEFDQPLPAIAILSNS